MDKCEIGCLLSHIKVYNESLENNDKDYILVIEDDVNLISFKNNNVINFLYENIHNYECVQLCQIISTSYKLPQTNPILLNWSYEQQKMYPWSGLWSTGAYIISKKGRQKILDVFKSNNKLMPSDFFIYSKINTSVLFPPIILPNTNYVSNISSNTDHHILSNNIIIQSYFKKKLVLIAVWFGKIPRYFNLWMSSLKNKDFDVLFITNQIIINHPDNLKILNITFDLFNDYLNTQTGYNVTIKNVNKIVDVKPLLGFLFYDFINHYDYWGWTDIDMIMGDISSSICGNHDIYSFGNKTFGPLMIFNIKIVDLFKHIDNYEEILNDKFICKVDEPWWFINNKKTNHLQIYKDENIFVRYYNNKNLIDFVKNKNTYVHRWSKICGGINWNIANTMKYKKTEIENYTIKNNKLFKNNTEIYFCHLTLLKSNNQFLEFINNNYLKYTNSFSFNVVYNYSREIYDINNLFNTYDIYNNFVNIKFEIC